VRLDINTDAAVNFSDKLERMSRSALPNAVRNTLNSAAFDVKKVTMPLSAASEFTQRRKTFFKAKSRVGMAKGWDINQMNSKIGFIGGGDNQAVRDLKEQEYGGQIKGRAFIPLEPARISNSITKNVRGKFKVKNIRNVDKINRKKNFYKVVNRVGKGGFVIYKSTMFFVKSIVDSKVELTAVYSYKKGRSANIKSTGFMRKASNKSAKKLNRFYEENAKRQIKRFKK